MNSTAQPNTGLTHTCPQTEVNDHLISLGVIGMWPARPTPTRCLPSRSGGTQNIHDAVLAPVRIAEDYRGPLRARQ